AFPAPPAAFVLDPCSPAVRAASPARFETVDATSRKGRSDLKTGIHALIFAVCLAATPAPAQSPLSREEIEAIVADYIKTHPDEIGAMAKDYVLRHPEVFREIFVEL